MTKRYSLLTILTVIILVGSAVEPVLSQKVVKLPSIKGKKIGKRGVITTVQNPPKPPKKTPPTTPLPEREPEQSSRWELTGEITVSGTETYLGGKCIAEMSHIYKSTVILDYMQQSFPSVTDPEELAKISVNLPKEIAASVGSSRTMWMVSPLKPPDPGNGKLHITISEKRECSILDANRRTWNKSIETLSFNDYVPTGGGGTVTLDKGQKSVWIGIDFEGAGGTAERKLQMPYGEPKLMKSALPHYPQIDYVTTNTIIPVPTAFLQNTNSGFTFTFPDQVGNDAIAVEKKPTVKVTYTFKKL
jgi:hypothetical protein